MGSARLGRLKYKAIIFHVKFKVVGVRKALWADLDFEGMYTNNLSMGFVLNDTMFESSQMYKT